MKPLFLHWGTQRLKHPRPTLQSQVWSNIALAPSCGVSVWLQNKILASTSFCRHLVASMGNSLACDESATLPDESTTREPKQIITTGGNLVIFNMWGAAIYRVDLRSRFEPMQILRNGSWGRSFVFLFYFGGATTEALLLLSDSGRFLQLGHLEYQNKSQSWLLLEISATSSCWGLGRTFFSIAALYKLEDLLLLNTSSSISTAKDSESLQGEDAEYANYTNMLCKYFWVHTVDNCLDILPSEWDILA